MNHPLFATLVTVALAAPVHAAPGDMQPGLWEITTETRMPGMPMQMPPQTVQHCYTAAELARAQNTVPQAGDPNCRVSDYRVEGDTASWTIECSGETQMRGRGTMTGNATSYTGEMDSTMTHPGGTMQMHMQWRGKRIGDCR